MSLDSASMYHSTAASHVLDGCSAVSLNKLLGKLFFISRGYVGVVRKNKNQFKFLQPTWRGHRVALCLLEFTFQVILLNHPSKRCPTTRPGKRLQQCYQWVPALPNPSHHFSHEQSHWLHLDFSQATVEGWHLSVPIKAQPLAPSSATQHFSCPSVWHSSAPLLPAPSPHKKCSPE